MRAYLLVAVAFVLMAGCASLDAAQTTSEASVPPGVLVVGDVPTGPYEFTTAILENGSYQHPHLDAQVDATIIWWNADNEVHSVVSDDGSFAGSGPVAPGSEFVYTFLTPGDYRYHCRYHANMTGVVIVR